MRVHRWIYFMQLVASFFYTTRISRRCRSADYQIAPDKRAPPRRVYTYIRGTFVLSRNGIIVRTVARDTSIMPNAPFRGRSLTRVTRV